MFKYDKKEILNDDNNKKIILLLWLPASWKSYFLKNNLVKEIKDLNKYKIIILDIVRWYFSSNLHVNKSNIENYDYITKISANFNKDYILKKEQIQNHDKEKLVWANITSMISFYIEEWYNIIFDATNINKNNRNPYLKKAKKHWYTTEVVYIHTYLDNIFSLNNKRIKKIDNNKIIEKIEKQDINATTVCIDKDNAICKYIDTFIKIDNIIDNRKEKFNIINEDAIKNYNLLYELYKNNNILKYFFKENNDQYKKYIINLYKEVSETNKYDNINKELINFVFIYYALFVVFWNTKILYNIYCDNFENILLNNNIFTEKENIIIKTLLYSSLQKRKLNIYIKEFKIDKKDIDEINNLYQLFVKVFK